MAGKTTRKTGRLPKHKDPDVDKLLRELQDVGWIGTWPGSHAFGFLHCPGGCRIVIYSTPRGNQRRALLQASRRCHHLPGVRQAPERDEKGVGNKQQIR